MSVYTDNDNRLCCPLCGGNQVWINRIVQPIGGPGGGPDWRPPTPEEERFALVGVCGRCIGQFALVFRPHISGDSTFVESVELSPPIPEAQMTDTELRAMRLVDFVAPGQRFTSPDTEPSRSREAK